MEVRRVTAIEAIIRFLREHNFDRGVWSTDLVCYSHGNRITRHSVERNGEYELKCHWYELELFLERELGLVDPERPKIFYKEKPKHVRKN